MIMDCCVLVFALIFIAMMSMYPLRWVACWKRFAFMRPMFCNRLEWHSPGPETTGHDGCSTHARCRWCGYEGMVDGQGNLF